jgi:hypothetical protein
MYWMLILVPLAVALYHLLPKHFLLVFAAATLCVVPAQRRPFRPGRCATGRKP